MATQAELIRRKDLCTRYSIPGSTLVAMRNPDTAAFDPTFPSPFRIGRQTLAWRIAEVEAWLESRRLEPSAPAGWWSQHVCLNRVEHNALTGVTQAFNRNGDTLAEFYAILPPTRHRDVYGESVAPTIGELLGDRDVEQVLRARRDELEIAGISVALSDDSVRLSFNDPYFAEASRIERMRSIDI